MRTIASSVSNRNSASALRELGLADAGGAEEQERAVRAVRVGQARARAADRVGDGAHGLVLADDALADRLLHLQQLLALAFEHLRDRNAGPLRDDLGDFLLGRPCCAGAVGAFDSALRGLGEPLLELGDLAVLELATCAARSPRAARRFELEPRALELLLDVRGALHAPPSRPSRLPRGPRTRCSSAVICVARAARRRFFDASSLFLLERLALDLELDDAPLEPVHRLGLRVDLHADARGRLVDQVDRLVGQLAVGDVAVRERRGGDDRGIGDVDAVVDLVALLEAAQDRDRVLDRGLVDQHLLEAALERGVLLDVLAVLVERGRADAVQLAARERGLEHVAGVHRALGLAGADHRVQLVDEQDDLAFLLREVVEHAPSAAPRIRRGTWRRRSARPCRARGCACLRRPSGTSPLTMRCARPSTIAVLPTPGSPISTGLFLVRRCSTWIVRRISSSRPMTGSSLPCSARSVRSIVYFSSAWRLSSAFGSSTFSPPRTSSIALLERALHGAGVAAGSCRARPCPRAPRARTARSRCTGRRAAARACR